MWKKPWALKDCELVHGGGKGCIGEKEGAAHERADQGKPGGSGLRSVA